MIRTYAHCDWPFGCENRLRLYGPSDAYEQELTRNGWAVRTDAFQHLCLTHANHETEPKA